MQWLTPTPNIKLWGFLFVQVFGWAIALSSLWCALWSCINLKKKATKIRIYSTVYTMGKVAKLPEAAETFASGLQTSSPLPPVLLVSCAWLCLPAPEEATARGRAVQNWDEVTPLHGAKIKFDVLALSLSTPATLYESNDILFLKLLSRCDCHLWNNYYFRTFY